MSFSNFKENLAERYANFKARMQERADRKIARKTNGEAKEPGRFKKWLSRVGAFAKRRPSAFAGIIIAIIVVLLFVTYEALHLTSTPQFCGQCHVETEVGPGAEYHTWSKNVHSFAEVGCIDCHGRPGFFGYMRAKIGGMYDLYGEIVYSKEHKMEILTKGATDLEYAKNLVPNDYCLICHSDDANKSIRDTTVMSFFGVEMRKVDGVKNPEFRQSNGLLDIYNDEMPNISFSHDNHVNGLGLSCLDCHSGVAHGGEFKNRPKMETCFACHDERRAQDPNIAAPANDDCAACHTSVVALHEGTLLLEEGAEPIPPSMMVDMGVYGAENCSSCHADAFDKPTAATCGTNCHGEMDYGFMFDEIRNEFDTVKAPLDALNIELYKALNKMTAEQKAQFNQFKEYYDALAYDKSKGIHNNELYRGIAEKATAIGTELANGLGIPVPAGVQN